MYDTFYFAIKNILEKKKAIEITKRCKIFKNQLTDGLNER